MREAVCRRLSPTGIKTLIEREAKRSRAYRDSRGIPTIGIGHTGPEVHMGLVWSDEQIEMAFRADLKRFEAAVSQVKVYLTQNQYDALVSFAFNVGTGAFLSSTLLRRLNEGRYAEASKEFRRWTIPAEVTTRRAGEWDQFNTPDGRPVHARLEGGFDARHP